VPEILAEEPAVLTIHARTRKEMSKVPAHWDLVKRVVEIRNELGSKTLIIGNGDAVSLEDAHAKIATSGADGVMLGRAIFGNPWLFHPEKDLSNIGIEERLTVMLEHTKLFSELLHFKNFATMKKHYKAYVNGFENAAQLRAELMEKNTYQEIETVVHEFLGK
jgi:tRNA-dihydrouridine synthase